MTNSNYWDGKEMIKKAYLINNDYFRILLEFEFTKVYENLLSKCNDLMLPATVSCHVMNVHTVSNEN